MPANDPSRTSFTLRIGVDEWLYNNITAGGAQATFGVPPQMSNIRGVIVFQVVPIPLAGTITSLIGQLECSIIPDGQLAASAFGIFNKLVPVGGGPATLSPYSGIAFTANIPIAFDLSGMGGNGKMRLNFPTFTLGTATGINIYAHIG
jgi:hypothetical protein